MLAARQRASGIARRLQRTARSYASDAHSHHTPAEGTESFGKGSLMTVTAFFGTVFAYQFFPDKGEESVITNFIARCMSKAEDWEEINAMHTKAMEQAGYDRNLFENASNKHRFVDLSYPEAFQSHAPRNIRAGDLINIDHVVEHYRQRHLKEEERKAKKMAEQKN